jgi:SAM-dependent methyltransferase
LQARFRADEATAAEGAECDWYRAHLPERALVLDAICGSGRLLVPLAAAGVKIHGCDPSAAMLALCEAGLAAAHASAPLYRQDLTVLNLPLRYGAAIVGDAAFQRIVESGGAREALARIRAHLVPPAIAILELEVPAIALHPPGAPVVEIRSRALEDGSRLTARSEIVVDAEARRIAIACRFERRVGAEIREREDEAWALTWYDEDTIRALLSAAGFTAIEIGPSPAPAKADERRFAVVARD